MPASPINKFNSLKGPIFDIEKTGFLRIGSHIELIRESVVRIVFTRKGTRMGNLDFGTNIPDLAFTNDWEGLQRKIAFEISEALAKWEPRVQFSDIQLIDLRDTFVEFKIVFIELVTNTEQQVPIVAEFVS